MVMDPAQLQKYEERCIQQRSPACKAACLLAVDIREMLQYVSDGNFNEAFKTLRKQIAFPGVIAYACEHPCQTACVREKLGGAIRINDLEKAVVAYGYQSPKIILPPPKAKKIAVVGGGLTGLTAALELGKKGYPVTLFEAKEVLGGSLCAVPQDILDRDLAALGKAKVDIRYGQALNWAEVLALKEQYDAVLLAAGHTFTAEAALPDGVFMGGSMLRPQEAPQPLRSLKDGLNAARAIESYFSGAAYREMIKAEEALIPALAGIEENRR